MNPIPPFSLAGLLIVSAFPSVGKADDVCLTLARNLKPDSLIQDGSAAQFAQLQQLVSSSTFASWGNASNSSLNANIDIPGEVDAALGTTSNASNWASNRSSFLSMSYQEASARSSFSNRLSNISVNALKVISDCAQSIANQNGFFVTLQEVSDNRDSFSVVLKHSTTGTADWALTTFAVNPPDDQFKCTDDVQRASSQHAVTLTEQTKVIGCSKNPRKSFLLTVQTTAGAAPSTFVLESVDEQIRKLRADVTQKMQEMDAQLERVKKPGLVAAFARDKCPPPWTEYQPAMGRFIRGIDRTGNIDPDGFRRVGSLQNDALGAHSHTMGIKGGDSTTMVPGGATQRLPNFVDDGWGGGGKKVTDESGGDETRPKNVALLYCILN